MSPTALFIIDVQNGLAQDPKTEIPHAERIRNAGSAILAKARSVIDNSHKIDGGPGLYIFFVQHEEGPDEGALNKGTKAWELVFEPRKGDAAESIVSKTTPDTFETNPRLADQLKAQRIGHIVACGIQSEYCVVSTCSRALALGFEVTVLSGAHSTYDTKDKKAVEIEREVEEELTGKGAKVVPWEDWEP